MNDLQKRFQNGDADALNDPELTKPAATGNWTPLHELAADGCLEVLKHPEAGTLRDKYGMTPLHHLAESFSLRRNSEQKSECIRALLTHPQVSTATTLTIGQTPMHLLAIMGCTEVIDHPQVTTARTFKGDTPLHFLASVDEERVMRHPEVATLKNNKGETPLEVLAKKGNYSAQKKLEEMKREQEVER